MSPDDPTKPVPWEEGRAPLLPPNPGRDVLLVRVVCGTCIAAMWAALSAYAIVT